MIPNALFVEEVPNKTAKDGRLPKVIEMIGANQTLEDFRNVKSSRLLSVLQVNAVQNMLLKDNLHVIP